MKTQLMEEANNTKVPLVKSKSGGRAAAPADLLAVVNAFNKCRRTDGTLATDRYLAALNELVRLVIMFPIINRNLA